MESPPIALPTVLPLVPSQVYTGHYVMLCVVELLAVCNFSADFNLENVWACHVVQGRTRGTSYRWELLLRIAVSGCCRRVR